MKTLIRNPFILLSFCLLFFLIGCAEAIIGTKYQYTFGLIKNKNVSEVNSILIDSSKAMKFIDDKIEGIFIVGETSISFTIKNLTSEVMKIIWDESSLVLFGKSHKVMHSGIKYNDRNSSQTPTVIPQFASITDIVLPIDNVTWDEGYNSSYYTRQASWVEKDLFLYFDYNKDENKNLILSSKGQKFSLYLPIQYQGKTLDYNINFIITDVKPTK